MMGCLGGGAMGMEKIITDFGARVGADALNTGALQNAIDEAAREGGRVVVPPGCWHTGTLRLRSHVELYLAPGAILAGTENPDDYPVEDVVAAGRLQSRRTFDRRLIFACGEKDVAITGEGTIDGNGGCAGHTFPRGNEGRPTNVQFVSCEDVRMENVHLRRAGSWMMHVAGCRKVSLRGLRIWNHGNRTNDGLDIDGSSDVRISDCDIDSHDDALVFKSTGPLPCRHIVVTGCRLRSNCHGIKFGTESVGGFEYIRVADCLLSPSDVKDPMPGYPEGRPLITGVALNCVDGGHMRHIQISGLIVERVFAPIFVKLGNRHDRRIPGEDFAGTGTIEDVSITDITAYQVGPYCCTLSGLPDQPIRRVSLRGLRLSFEGGLRPERILPRVHEENDLYPEINMFSRVEGKRTDQVLPAWALYARHIDALRVGESHFQCRKPDARNALHLENVKDHEVTGLRIETP